MARANPSLPQRLDLFLEADKNARFNFLPGHGGAVVTCRFAALRCTAVAVLCHDGEPATATTAFEEARQQELPAMGPVKGIAILVSRIWNDASL